MKSWKWYWLLMRPKNLGLTLLLQAVFMMASSRQKGSADSIAALFRIDWSNFRWPESLLVTLSCLLTAAAGYVINDLYDVETDRINTLAPFRRGDFITYSVRWVSFLPFYRAGEWGSWYWPLPCCCTTTHLT